MALQFLNDGYFAGKVGIGIENPVRLLSLYSDNAETTPRLLIEQDGTGDAVIAFSLTGGQGWSMGIDNSLGDAFMIHNSAGGVDSSSQFTILNSGNVGIGTTSPGAKLEIITTRTGTPSSDTNIKVTDDTAQAADVGGSINFTGKYTDAGVVLSGSPFIRASKKNSTTGDYGYGLKFGVRATGSGTSNVAMTIDSNSNVGIGDIPSFKLDVNVTSSRARFKATSGDANIELSSIAGHDWLIQSKSDSSLAIYDEDEASERMRIDSAGNVGIGQNDPDHLLDLYKSTSTTSSTTGTTLQRLWNYVGADINQQKTFIDFVFQDDNSNEYPQVRIGAEVGQNGDANTQEKEGSGAFVVYTNNATGVGPGSPTGLAERFRVDYAGNVGIGTASPSQKLHVAGNARVTGAYYDSNNSPGTANQVLVSTVTGTDWIDGSAIPGVPAGSGTLNTVAMWTPDGDTLGDSPITISGSNSTFAGDVTIPEYIYHTGDANTRFGFSSNDNFLVETGGINMFGVNATTVFLKHTGNTKLITTGTGVTVTGDIQIDSALLSNQENTDVDTGTETIASVAIATYTAAFFDFVIKKTTNVRSGTVYACHDGTNVEFTETSTQDLGDTSDVTLSVDISGTDMRLRATTTSDDWSVKSLIRAI